MALLQSLPQELFKQIIEYVMRDDEPVDFGAFLASVEQANKASWIRCNHKRSLAQPADWESMADGSTQAIQKAPLIYSEFWRRSRSLHLQSHLRDWKIACIHSQHFRAMGKIAFWEKKTFLMSVQEAGVLQKSIFRQLSQRDQKMAAQRIKIVMFPVEKISATILKGLCKQTTGFSRLSQLTISLGWTLGPDSEYDRNGKSKPAESYLQEIMSSYGAETQRISVIIQIHSKTHKATWENYANFLLTMIFPGIPEFALISFLWLLLRP